MGWPFSSGNMAVGGGPKRPNCAPGATVWAEIGCRRRGTACAIGEIGLDYHYDFSPRDVQHAVFRAQLQLARTRDLPVVIHTREAEDDTLRIISEESRGELRGVFHCFSGDPAAAARALGTGFHVSIPGIVTFPKSSALRDAARAVPTDRLLIETDSPYLAPVPFRGKRNEPGYVVETLDLLAEVRGVTRDTLGTQLVQNFDTLFASSSRSAEPDTIWGD
jgi:TatD DNase family protein